MLGCQTTVYCNGLPLQLAPRRLSKRHSLDINGFQSALLSALCLPNGWHGLVASYDTDLHAILDRLDCAISVHTVTRCPLAGIPTFQYC